MCTTCGCSAVSSGHHHPHHHDHGHDHDRDGVPHHHHDEAGTAVLERRLLAKNDHFAGLNRALLAERGIVAVNLISSPGAGKTTLLERTVRHFAGRPVRVIEGDQATSRDAERIRAAGCEAVQVNTGAGCHLDAAMVHRALGELDLDGGGLLFIENVGNLVCPALFDLGEAAKVVIASVTEGDDKPVKYPHAFRGARVAVLNKIDLAPHVDFDAAAFEGYARLTQPRLQILPVSARTGERLDTWYAWLGTAAHARA